jgi:hypothetical protein
MPRKWTTWLGICVTAFAVGLTAALAGCGDSGSQSVESTPTAGNPSAVFLKPGSPTNGLVEFGHEGTASQRKAAAAVLTKNLRAREVADFKTQCATVARVVAEKLSPEAKGPAAIKACPGKLRELATPLGRTKAFRESNFDGEIVALRVKGKGADALYHGTDKKDYAMPMVKEQNRWMVGNITAIALNPKQKQTSGRSPKKNSE